MRATDIHTMRRWIIDKGAEMNKTLTNTSLSDEEHEEILEKFKGYFILYISRIASTLNLVMDLRENHAGNDLEIDLKNYYNRATIIIENLEKDWQHNIKFCRLDDIGCMSDKYDFLDLRKVLINYFITDYD